MNVYFEHSIIFGEVRIGCFSGDYMEIYLWKCCFDQLKIYGHAKIKSVELCYCSGGCLEFSNTNLHEFRCSDSIITAIRSENTKFDSSQLSNTSIDIEKSLNMSINDFQWTSLPLSYLNSSSKINEKKDKEYSNRRKIYDSIQLLKNSPMNFSLKEYVNMERKEFLSRDSVLGYLFGKLTDLLVSPLKLFVLILFVIFYFSVIYWDNIFINSSGNLILSLDFSSAFLFSGITFTTIGYGNMVPQDESLQLLAVIEGLIGICAGGAILVALTRKYLDHK